MYTLVNFYDAKKKLPVKKKGKKHIVVKKPEVKPIQSKKPKPEIFERNIALENHYRSQLINLAKQTGQIVSKEDLNNLDAYPNMIRRLNRYAETIEDWAETVAKNLIINMNNDDEQLWKRRDLDLSLSLQRELTTVPIEPLLRQYMDEQIHLIKSIPRKASERIHRLIYSDLYRGNLRSKTLADLILQTEDISKSRANLIARTEISKISTGLMKVRAQQSGLDWYVWRSTHDARARESHKFMEGVLCSWQDKPNPERLIGKKHYDSYHAGEIFNCRCFPQPLIRLNDIAWPARVHRNDRIVKMNRDQFQKLFGGDYGREAA